MLWFLQCVGIQRISYNDNFSYFTMQEIVCVALSHEHTYNDDDRYIQLVNTKIKINCYPRKITQNKS